MQRIANVSALDELLARIETGDRLSFEEWKLVEDGAPTEELGRLADELRQRLHPDGVVTYVVDRNINYSNVCVSVCSFLRVLSQAGLARRVRAHLRRDLR